MAQETKQVEVGDLKLSLSLDTKAVDEFVARLERALQAFKKEWQRDVPEVKFENPGADLPDRNPQMLDRI